MKDGVSALSWQCQLWKITTLNWLFTHTSPAEQSQQEIPPPIFIFPMKTFLFIKHLQADQQEKDPLQWCDHNF